MTSSRPELAPTIRSAVPGDLPGIRSVADEHDVLASWPEQPDFLDAELAFGRLAVAEVDGVVAGFSGTVPRGQLTYLGDLFIRGDAQSAGLGRALLEHVLAGTGAVVTFASADERAWARYLKAGLIPRTPLVYLAGRVRELPTTATGGDRDVDVDRAVELDAVASGGARAAVLGWYAGLAGVGVHTVGDSYAFTRTVKDKVIIGPAGGAPAVEAAIAAAGDRDLQISLLGSHPLLPRLIRAGLRIADRDTFMSTGPAFDPEHYVPNVSIG